MNDSFSSIIVADVRTPFEAFKSYESCELRLPVDPCSESGIPRVWGVKLEFPVADDELRRFRSSCSSARAFQASLYQSSDDSGRCLAAGWLLSQALNGYLGLTSPNDSRGGILPEMARDKFHEMKDPLGRPYLPGFPGLHISFSHSGEWVFCAIHARAVGVDIESSSNWNDAGDGDGVGNELTAEVFMSAQELAVFTRSSESDRKKFFFDLWTSKEACLKALGSGFKFDPKNLSPMTGQSQGDASWGEMSVRGDSRNWRLLRMGVVPGYELALCWENMKAENGISSL